MFLQIESFMGKKKKTALKICIFGKWMNGTSTLYVDLDIQLPFKHIYNIITITRCNKLNKQTKKLVK